MVVAMSVESEKGDWKGTLVIYLASIWLLLGAVNKIYSAAFSLSPELLGIQNRQLVAWVGTLELLLVLLIFFQLWIPVLRKILVLLLLLFALVHISILIGLKLDCGCMGEVEVPSWLMILINGGFAVCVWLYIPFFIRWNSKIHFIITSIIVWVVISIGLWSSLQVPEVYIVQKESRQDDSVFSDPVTEVLMKVPELKEGRWRVVLWRTNCSSCIEDLPNLEQEARRDSSKDSPWCFINVGVEEDYRDRYELFRAPWVLRIHQIADKVATPTVLSIDGGQVVVNYNNK